MNSTTARQCVTRISSDLSLIARDPLDNIYVRALNESDITVLDAVIVGPEGFFHFKMSFPPEYPYKPPHVVLQTTDSGKVRFNPNLYASGKVCLSILGTWQGPAWSSAHNISSVLLSIQSLMNQFPYHNEPGFEKERRPGDAEKYNERIYHENLRVAVCGMMESPTFGTHFFRDVLDYRFLLYYDHFEQMCRANIAKYDKKQIEDPFGEVAGVYDYASILVRLQAIRQAVMKNVLAVSLADFASTAAAAATIATSGTKNNNNNNNNNNNYNNSNEGSLMVGYTQSSLADLAMDASNILKKALRNLTASDNSNMYEGIHVSLDGDNIRKCYLEEAMCNLEVVFSVLYPDVQPFVRFLQPVFHPNITTSGIPCLPLLCNYSIENLLVSLRAMLNDPSVTDTVNPEAAECFVKDNKTYKKRIIRSLEQQ